jgi:hypothetical protein
MADVVILLQGPTDRKVFDLFNWLKVAMPEHHYLVWARSISRVEKWLYAAAQQLEVASVSALLYHITAKPQTTFVWLPLEEAELVELLQQPTLPPNLKLLAPSSASLNLARNKTSLSRHFMDRALTPRLYSIEELKVNFPESGVVAKPAVGKGAIGRQYINSVDELHKIQPGDTIQQRIGAGKEVIGAFFLMQNGKVVRHYQHQRVRTYPTDGGVSSCAKTVDIPEIAERGAAILADLNWHGLAMLEFLQDPHSGQHLAIECNPRLWGSCLLGEFAGYGLVEDYIRLALNEPLPERQPLPQAFIRWYFPYEMLYALRSPIKRFHLLLGGEPNTCYIGGTRAGWWRAVVFIAASLLKVEKWLILFKKITGTR